MTLSMNELFGSEAKHLVQKLNIGVFPGTLHLNLKISDAKYSYFPWYSSSPSTKSKFSWHSSLQSADSPLLHRFIYIFQHSPYNLGFKNKHPGFNHDQVVTKGCTKKLLIGRSIFWLEKNHYNPTLTKLASYKSSILKFLYSMKPENCSAPNILCNLNHYIPHDPSDAASGISTILKLTPYFLLPLGALRLYHNYGRLSLKVQIMLYKKQLMYNRIHRIVHMVGLGDTSVLSRWETIPYLRRKHFVIIPASKDKSFGDYLFKKAKILPFKNILPLDHPHSVRVRAISNKIIQALRSDLKKIKKMNDLEFGSMNINGNFDEKKQVKLPWWGPAKFSTRHLERLRWKVVVSDEHSCNASCLPGGRIVLYNGLFTRFKSDAEIAAIIGHEVGHVVARHAAEYLTKQLLFIPLGMLFIPLVIPLGMLSIPLGMQSLKARVLSPGRQRTENEADYIGLLLMASAGYDPRVAPKVYEMLDDTEYRPKFSTHPSGKQRSEVLSKPEMMEEAMIRFSKVTKRQRCRKC